jgi:hypothetical protein
MLDEAVAALPQNYRVPFVLHHLEGASVAEVARRLGCPPGTVAARLARAKVRLRARLSRQGVTLSAAVFVAALSDNAATASVPGLLTERVVQAAVQVAVSRASLAVSAASAVFIKGVMKTMTMTKLQVAALLLATSAFGVGAGLCWQGTMNIGGDDSPDRVHSSASTTKTQIGNPSSHQEARTINAERHFAGGFRSTRGFEFRGAAPQPGACEKCGDFEFLNSIEYQIPICASDTIYQTAFVDSGTVGNLVDKDCRVGAGFGLRILVPQLGPVPISLDFGFPITRCEPGTGPS